MKYWTWFFLTRFMLILGLLLMLHLADKHQSCVAPAPKPRVMATFHVGVVLEPSKAPQRVVMEFGDDGVVRWRLQ